MSQNQFSHTARASNQQTAVSSPHATRNAGLDLLRVLACYMVVQIHTGEFFYIAPSGILHGPGNFWVALYNSLFRCCVPLFVMISGYFLFPIAEGPSSFLKKKMPRILCPFVFWCIIYALYPFLTGSGTFATALTNIAKIPVNFGTEVGHLWYVYMLIGVYLIAPIVSPWLKTASKRNIEFYLGLWAATNLIPYLHQLFPEIWGECYWNSTPMLYYFSGFLGYAVLGCYIKRFHSQKGKFDLALGLTLILIGYAVTAYGFGQRFNTANSVAALELTWAFNTINVAMIAMGFFLVVKNVSFTNPNAWHARLIKDISLKSYGIYLVHILILNFVHERLLDGKINAAFLIPLTAMITFTLAYLVVKILSYLPKSKFIVG